LAGRGTVTVSRRNEIDSGLVTSNNRANILKREFRAIAIRHAGNITGKLFDG